MTTIEKELLSLFVCGKVKKNAENNLSLHLARKLVPYGLLYINISSVSPSNKYIQHSVPMQ